MNEPKNLVVGALRVLVVEDSVDDTFFVVRELQRGGFQVTFERVETAADMQAALRNSSWDLIVCDYRMPQFSGEGALTIYLQSKLDIPFVVVSGAAGEDIAVDMIKAGAHNYVKKDHLERLAPAVMEELSAVRERRLRRQNEEASGYMASLVASCEDAIIGASLDGTILTWNGGAQRLFGYAADEVVGRSASILAPPQRPPDLPELLEKLRRGERVEHFETVRRRKDGSYVEVSLTLSPVRNAEGQVMGVSVIERDITARKQQENEHLGLIQDLTAELARTNPSRESLPA